MSAYKRALHETPLQMSKWLGFAEIEVTEYHGEHIVFHRPGIVLTVLEISDSVDLRLYEPTQNAENHR